MKKTRVFLSGLFGFVLALAVICMPQTTKAEEQVKAEIPNIRKREKVFKVIFALALEKEGNITETEIIEIIRKEGE